MQGNMIPDLSAVSTLFVLAPAYPPCVRALGSQRKARIRISIIPIGICPASSQESAVQPVETLEQDGRKIHARPQSRQKSQERKSGVPGKRVSARVDFGGRGCIKKKTEA